MITNYKHSDGGIYPINAVLGKNVNIPHPTLVNIYGNDSTIIGDSVLIGTFVEIQSHVIIGKNSRIQSHAFICEGVDIGENCFISHGVMFVNDRYPRANNRDWTLERTLIKNNVSIGTGSTIMCGIIIGKNSIIGANSLVLKDIPDNEIWAGNPARFLRKL